MRYRRSYSCGGTFFFTLVTDHRKSLFSDICTIDLLKKAIQKVKLNYPFRINAFVILPDHVHCLWTLPETDDDYSLRWRLIKSIFTHNYCLTQQKNKHPIWQQRFWEHQIRDDEDFTNHVNYIHYNPVKHGYVTAAADWPHSSFRYYVKQGILDKKWGVGMKQLHNIGNE